MYGVCSQSKSICCIRSCSITFKVYIHSTDLGIFSFLQIRSNTRSFCTLSSVWLWVSVGLVLWDMHKRSREKFEHSNFWLIIVLTVPDFSCTKVLPLGWNFNILSYDYDFSSIKVLASFQLQWYINKTRKYIVMHRVLYFCNRYKFDVHDNGAFVFLCALGHRYLRTDPRCTWMYLVIIFLYLTVLITWECT